ncbi:MAG: hypothetical protein E6J91_13515 [Deltaproteobacteria bacterium]|nr:MAG: hypothetical protein E6J91_13515 [Deltaproteobacteria bacterium]
MQRTIDGVRSEGWTPTDVRLAAARLSEIVAGRAAQPDEEGDALAIELVRWLRYAAEVDADEIVDCLASKPPPSRQAPRWDDLHAQFAQYDSSAELTVALSRRYDDPARVLMEFLDDVAPLRGAWQEVTEEHHRALELLLAFGTDETITYALSRLDLMNWETDDELAEVVRRHHAAIRRLAIAAWPSMSWEQRVDVASLFEQYGLYDEALLALLLKPEIASLTHEDRAEYVHALGVYRDARIVPRLQAILDWALEELAARRTDEGRDLVHLVISQLRERELAPTSMQQERATALGVLQE